MSIPLFRTATYLEYPSSTPEQWPVVRGRIAGIVEQVVQYHRTARTPVNGGHPLITLINTIATPLRLPLDRYLDAVNVEAVGTAKVLGYTTFDSPGRNYKAAYYRQEGPEITLAYKDYFDLEAARLDWQDIAAVNPVLIHDDSIHYRVPKGSNYPAADFTSLPSVISIHVPLLMVQWYCFVRHQLAQPITQRRGVREFIGGYVLPNMLRRQVELQLMNKIINRYTGTEAEPIDPQKGLQIAIPDITYYVDVAVDKMLINITRKAPEFAGILQNLKAFDFEDMSEALVIPDIMPTRQVDWTLFLSRIKHFSFLCDVAHDQEYKGNQDTVNSFARAIRSWGAADMVLAQMGKEIHQLFLGYISNIEEKTGTRILTT
jgi:hypothetical protein